MRYYKETNETYFKIGFHKSEDSDDDANRKESPAKENVKRMISARESDILH